MTYTAEARKPRLAIGEPQRRGPLGAPLGLLIGGLLAFVAIAADEVFHGRLFQFNAPIALYFHEHNTPLGVVVFSAISYLGDFKILLPYGLFVGVWLFLRPRQGYTIWLWGTMLIGCALLNEVLKHLFKVPRPMRYTFYLFPLRHPGYSFPSGHTMGVTITAAATTLFAIQLNLLTKKQRGPAIAGAAFLGCLVAFSLLYMGVHTFTEVLAGLAVSAMWVGAIATVIALKPLRPLR